MNAGVRLAAACRAMQSPAVDHDFLQSRVVCPHSRFNAAMNIHRPCPVCGTNAANSPTLHGIADPPWNLKYCRQCKFVFLENPPILEILVETYSWDKTFEEERKRRRKEQSPIGRFFCRCLDWTRATVKALTKRDKLKSLCSTYFRGGTILDLGCDTGYNADAMPPTAIPLGIEISPALAEKARRRFEEQGGRVIVSSVLEGLGQIEDCSCSGAIAKSYFEHEIWPREVLLQLRRVLQDGAHLIVKVPNYASWLRRLLGARWSGYRFPDHVNYFTPASLERLLEETGFAVTRLRIADKMPTSDNMWCVAEKVC